jgi:hypothetical protein
MEEKGEALDIPLDVVSDKKKRTELKFEGIEKHLGKILNVRLRKERKLLPQDHLNLEDFLAVDRCQVV